MSEKMVRVMRERSHRMHDLLLEMGEGLTEEQLRWIPSQTAPPIRWHLWHIGRFADMHHAEFLADADSSASLTSEEMEIWHKENIALAACRRELIKWGKSVTIRPALSTIGAQEGFGGHLRTPGG